MNKQGQQEQEIFLLQTHAGVGQDKATPPRMHAASDQPFNATTPAYRDSSATPPKKHHGSQKRQLREVAGCVPQQTFDEIERMRVQWGKHGKKLSRSQVVGTLVKQGVQKNVDIKYGSMLEPVIREEIKRQIQSYSNRNANLAVHAYYSAEQARILILRLLSLLLDNVEELPELIAHSQKQSRENLKYSMGEEQEDKTLWQ
jgi:hypothetical protein